MNFMMEYEEFKEKLKNDLIKHYNKDFIFYKDTKINVETEFLILNEGQFRPRISVTELYESYRTKKYEEILFIVIDMLNKASLTKEKEKLAFEKATNLEKYSDDISMRVINAERNAKLLEDVAHRKILDLAIIYYMNLGESQEGTMGFCIRNVMLTEDFNEEKLYQVALKNLGKPNIFEMRAFMNSFFNINDTDTTANGSITYIISNQNMTYGAICGLLPEYCKQFAETYECDKFYILPSSVHEIIAVVPNEEDEDYVSSLKDMVCMVNNTTVRPEEQLSDNVYCYQNGEITIC